MTWDPRTWKRSLRLLLGFATIWPIIYVVLFMTVIFSIILFGSISGQSTSNSTRLDLIQFEKKIKAGEIKSLKVKSDEIEAIDQSGRSYKTSVDNDSTRDDLVRLARQTGPNNQPLVEKIDESTSPAVENPMFPIGVAALFLCHILTILLIFVLMPLYIIFALKNERVDETMRIVWIVLACTFGILSNAVYWYLYIWRKPSPASMS